MITEGDKWHKSTWANQDKQLNMILSEALDFAEGDDWIFLLADDEFLIFDKSIDDLDHIQMSLFDIVITEEDVNKKFHEREWAISNARIIPFATRAKYFERIIHHRTPVFKGIDKEKIKSSNVGRVKHYGRSISIKDHDEKCDYYVQCSGNATYINKWSKRKGNAIMDIDKNNMFKWSLKFPND